MAFLACAFALDFLAIAFFTCLAAASCVFFDLAAAATFAFFALLDAFALAAATDLWATAAFCEWKGYSSVPSYTRPRAVMSRLTAFFDLAALAFATAVFLDAATFAFAADDDLAFATATLFVFAAA